jgi:hypothetical protein
MWTWGSKAAFMKLEVLALMLTSTIRQESELAINIRKATSIGRHHVKIWLARLVANTYVVL